MNNSTVLLLYILHTPKQLFIATRLLHPPLPTNPFPSTPSTRGDSPASSPHFHTSNTNFDGLNYFKNTIDRWFVHDPRLYHLLLQDQTTGPSGNTIKSEQTALLDFLHLHKLMPRPCSLSSPHCHRCPRCYYFLSRLFDFSDFPHASTKSLHLPGLLVPRRYSSTIL